MLTPLQTCLTLFKGQEVMECHKKCGKVVCAVTKKVVKRYRSELETKIGTKVAYQDVIRVFPVANLLTVMVMND